MNSSINQQIQHFYSSSKSSIIAAGEAAAKSDWSFFKEISQNIARSKPVECITNTLNSSKEAFRSLLNSMSGFLDSANFIRGAIGCGIGGGMLAEVAGLSAAFGISILTVEVIAIALILWGIFTCFPALWNMVKNKFEKVFDEALT